ncbi:hypothetical protein DFQ28_008181 [Apophysomyces sp. BC1034]|nr:hypothetical protein DFQ30_007902 [Apophysomyces sp. BC1015]KAG0176384.1 hypothetical protein DFQ29_006187 [Apophysomyces sp. BC1021]KAG0186194.1 hypothetical protein DFQ28_008181 [Apophysomyces sp. BC1034]
MAEDQGIAIPQFQQQLELRSDPIRGRGVFTNAFIPRNTLIDISPVLLFSHDEYERHGQHTILDEYTYRWKDGYALALGLGSMFNHSNNPNVGYVRSFEQRLIRYITMNDIQADEELCISYGSHLWFDNTEADGKAEQNEEKEEEETPWWQQMAID